MSLLLYQNFLIFLDLDADSQTEAPDGNPHLSQESGTETENDETNEIVETPYIPSTEDEFGEVSKKVSKS